MSFRVRPEQPADFSAISQLTEAAFRVVAHSSHTEHFIVAALRRAEALKLSLVAVDGETVVGHVAISPVTVASGTPNWFGLGPISVAPPRQRQGIGTALMELVLDELRCRGAAGCVVLGNPAYYGRFGFRVLPELSYPGVPGEYFQALHWSGDRPVGVVTYHDAFAATE